MTVLSAWGVFSLSVTVIVTRFPASMSWPSGRFTVMLPVVPMLTSLPWMGRPVSVRSTLTVRVWRLPSASSQPTVVLPSPLVVPVVPGTVIWPAASVAPPQALAFLSVTAISMPSTGVSGSDSRTVTVVWSS